MVQTKRKTSVIAVALILCLALILGVMAFIAAPSAETAQAAWDGEGNGTAASPYQIGTAAQLKKFRDIVNGTNGETQNVYACAILTADINLDGSEEDQWVPISVLNENVYFEYNYNEMGFLGVFDGNGHTVSGLYYNDADTTWENFVNDYVGLFGVVGRANDESGIIRNLTVEGSLTAGNYVGGIVGALYGTVDNCVNKVNVTGNSNIGGIAGRAMPGSVIRRATNKGTLTGYSSLGGIVGYIQGYYDGETKLSIPSLVVNCVNNGALSASSFSDIGGIAGAIHRYVSVVYCYNAATINVTCQSYANDPSVGGIVGRCGGVKEKGSYDDEQSLVENCYNAGDITTDKNAAICGVVGAAGYSAMIRYCLNYGTLTVNAASGTKKMSYGGVASRSFYSGENATVKNVYYKEGTAENDGDATKKSSAELKDKETFKDTTYWYSTGYYLDFDYCWVIGDVGPVFISADSLDVAYAISKISKFLDRSYYSFPDDGPMIYTAKKAYELLSEAQKKSIPYEYGEKLDEAVSVYAVLEKIHSVGKIYYSTDVKERLDAAQEAYDALSVEWKQCLSDREASDLAFYQKQYANAVVLYDYLGRQGIGSDEDPFLISTKEQLFRINDVISASYKLVCDIDAECDEDHQWVPIGTYQGIENDPYKRWSPYYEVSECRGFTGVLDGDGHTVKGLYIDVSDKVDGNDYTYYNHYAALIYSVGTEGKVKNLTVEGTIIGKSYVSGIAAMNNGIIDGCVNRISITGIFYLGGIAGYNWGQVINCKNFASVTGATEQEGMYTFGTCGGIVGITMDKSIVKNCTNSGDVIGRERIGGIAGYCGGGQVWNCSNSGNVSGYTRTGGIVGSLLSATDWWDFPVEQCCNAGAIVGTSDYTGGIVGYIERPYGAEETGIENTYNTGAIQGTDYVGGLIGNLPYGCKIRISHNVGTVSGTGSNVGQLTGKQESGSEVYISYYRSDTDTNSYAMTTEQFKNLSNFGGNAGYWRNGEVWMAGDDYPIFISAEIIKAREVSTYIGNIGSVSYTPGSKDAIDAAKEAYDNLTEEEKALIPQETKDALQKAIDDYNAVDAVVLLIDAIGEVSYPGSKDAIDEAKDVVSDLTDDQKAMLGDYENALKEAEADYAEGAIDAIGEVSYPDSKDAIDEAKDAVSDLDDDQLPLVGNLSDLKDAETEFAKGAIDAIGDVTYPGSKDAIDAAKDAIADLDDDQLAEVDNLGDLEDAEKLFDAMGKIDAIGDVSYPGSKDAIDAAKAAVAALDDDQLPLVGNLDDLKDAETEFAKGAIAAIGDVSYPGSKDAIDAAKDAIADLDDDQLAEVDNLGDLEDAEKLFDAMGKIDAIGDVSYPGSKDAIDAAKAAVAALDDDQLSLVGNLADLKDAETDYAIGAINAIGEVTYPGSKDAIKAAKDAISDLDDEQLAAVTNLDELYNAEMKFVEEAIAAIGEVNYPGSKEKIDLIKDMIADLDEDQLSSIGNLDDLYLAEVAYAEAAIAAIGEVTYPDSQEKIVAAREAYDAVDDELKQYVSNYDELIEAENTFVENIEVLIDAIGTVEYSGACEEKIDAANQAYDALSEHLKSLVNNADVLTQANDDYYSVQDAVSAIKAIGTLYYVDEIKNYIEQARAVVDDLSDHQASILPEEYLKILVDDEAAYEAMDKIDAIPLPLENTKDCLDKVNEAERFFNGLTEDQQSLVRPAFVSKLNDAANVKNAMEAVNAIGEVENTPEDKDLIDKARELIDAVLDNDKIADLLPDSVVKDLEDKEAVYDALGVIAIIGTPENTQSFRDKVDDARDAYDALSEDQKALVNELFVKGLEDAEAIIDAMDEINKIGDVEYTEGSKDKIDAAREMYDALTEDQKATFPADVLKTLINAEKAYEAMDLINAIGTVEYTAESKAKIDTAMGAFEALTPEQKELVLNHTKLPAAQDAYNDLEDNAKANNVKTLIAAIGKVKHPKSKDAIQEARTAYDELTEKQKELVDNYDTLTEAEEIYASYDKKESVSTAMGWVIFALVILELLYLACYFILWYPKAGAVAKKLKLGALKPLLAKIVLFGFIDLLLLIGSAASVLIFILALAALCVYATPISIVTFVLAFLVMAAYGALIFFRWKKRGEEEKIAEEPKDPDVIEAATPVEGAVRGTYHIIKDSAGKCAFVLYCGDGDNLSKEMGPFASEKAAYLAIKALREKGEGAKVENRVRGGECLPAPKFVLEKDAAGVYRYSFLGEKGDVLLQSVQYLNEKRCVQDLKKALLAIMTEEIVVEDGDVKGDVIEAVEETPVEETAEEVIEEVAADDVADVEEESSLTEGETSANEEVETKNEGFSLKENIALARSTVSHNAVNKQYIADYLRLKYASNVECNMRGNVTKTGLPLADTHYAVSEEGKKCFVYVYEVEGTTMLLVKMGDEYGKALTEKHQIVKRSAFPKSKLPWYSVIIDDSFTPEEIEKILDDAYLMNGGKPATDEGLSLKESLAMAKAAATKIHRSKKGIADYLTEEYGDKVGINARGNRTKTGLPLADTHYAVSETGKRCFAYVYETDSALLLLLRLSESCVENARVKGHKIMRSAFPKAKVAWYSVVLDAGYSAEDIRALLNDAYEAAK